MTLYELTQEQLYLYDLLANGDGVNMETGEIDPVVAEQLELTGKELDNKIKGVGIVYKQLVADAKMLKEEEENLVARRKRAERNAELLKNRLESTLITLGKDEFKDTKVSISFRKSTRVEIVDENKLPKEFIVEKTTYTPSKTMIMEAFKSGANVEGAMLVEAKNIQIK